MEEGRIRSGPGLPALLLLMLCMLMPSGASADAQPRILLLGNDTVRPGLLAELQRVSRDHGIETVTGYVESLEPEPGPATLESFELVIVFAPSHAIARPERVQALREALAARGTPMVLVHRERTETDGLDAALGERLGSYLTEGGERNLDALYASIGGEVLGMHDNPVPQPIRYPERGIYHPDYPEVVFPDIQRYRNWYGAFGDRPVIGVAVHDIHIRHTLTGWIDATVSQIEAAGGVPLVFYVPVNDPEGMPAVVAPDGEPVIDVLLFYRVALNPEGRRRDFDALGIPVLQGLIYRDGDEAVWRADPVGFPRGSTPFYFAMAEMAGVIDPTVVAAERDGDGQVVPVQPELEMLVRRAMNQALLARMPNADKRLGIYIYNYPSGETNFSASNLNMPESLAATLRAMEQAGYTVTPADAERITEAGKRLVGSYYPEADLDRLLADDLATLLPVDQYRAWLAGRGEGVVQRTTEEWGEPESARTVIEREGRHYFVIPRMNLGNVALLPQPPRSPYGDAERAGSYHDTDLPFSHDYLASYAWLHQAHEAHALIHFGTHGSAEFGVGKTRGLALDDDPHALVGELPHVYPYIVDNLAEATLAKRRLRATMISHQTPPFAPAALYHDLVDLHHLVHDWETMDDGAARDRVQAQIIAVSREFDIHQDLGFEDHALDHHFHHYLHELHDYIHAMAQQSEPIGLHTFGLPAEDRHLVTTVMQMLGDDYLELISSDPEELFAGDHETAVFESRPYRELHDYLLGGTAPDGASEALHEQLQRAADYMQSLRDQRELPALLAALEGRFVEPSVGGDPIRNPDSLPTGRNLYGFDPSRVPTRAAFETGAELMEGLIADHQAEHGRPPERLAFTLWSMEVMRHHGVVEGQVLTALGVRPVWNDRGRLAGVEVVPAEELGRPRVDVLLQTSGLYRDAFAGTLELLAEAAALAAGQDEPDNPVRAMTRTLAEQLAAAGLDTDAVQRLSRTRAFSSDIGQYGLGLDGAVADVDAWSNGSVLDEAYMGRVFLDRLQHAYGPDPEHWGETVPGLNLFETQLAAVDAAIFARSSNLYGLLSSDDPFQYLGGLSLGAMVAGGERPALYISNLRDPASAQTERADRFLSRELRTRYHHPRWLQSMVAEGYSGTTTLQATIENFWGWQATAPEMVRDDQWTRFFDIYVDDAYDLGLDAWFEAHNPGARTRIVERMLDAVRTGHWTPDDAVLEALVAYHQEWTEVHGGTNSSATRDEFIMETAAGFGMNAALPGGAAQPVTVTGQVMQPVNEAGAESARDWLTVFYLLALLLCFLLGAGHQGWRARRASMHSNRGVPA